MGVHALAYVVKGLPVMFMEAQLQQPWMMLCHKLLTSIYPLLQVRVVSIGRYHETHSEHSDIPHEFENFSYETGIPKLPTDIVEKIENGDQKEKGMLLEVGLPLIY